MDSAIRIRGGDPEISDIRDLFWTDGQRRRDEFRIAAEMIVEEEHVDDFGRPATATSTFLRYEIVIGYTKPSPGEGLLGRLVLKKETLDYITQGEAFEHLNFDYSAKDFRQSIVKNKRRSPAGFISSEIAKDGQTEIVVHQDGGSRGPGQRAPAESAPRTIVGTSNTSSTPTILAARREMQSWRLLALEPSAMRRPSRYQDEQHITTNGGHLAAALFRLAGQAEKSGGSAKNLYAEVTSRLSELVPVSDMTVDRDEERRLLTLEVTERSGIVLPASSLSDGTLRFLTLALMAVDPAVTGLVCMEEPENGIHPAKMEAMVGLLRELAVDADEAPGEDNPLRQVVVATHSPPFVLLQEPGDLVLAQEATLASEHGQPIETIRCFGLEDSWRAKASGRAVGMSTIIAYLTNPKGSQLKMPVLEVAYR
jgi:predicted ATPase